MHTATVVHDDTAGDEGRVLLPVVPRNCEVVDVANARRPPPHQLRSEEGQYLGLAVDAVGDLVCRSIHVRVSVLPITAEQAAETLPYDRHRAVGLRHQVREATHLVLAVPGIDAHVQEGPVECARPSD